MNWDQAIMHKKTGKCCIYFFICYASVWLATAITKYSTYIAFIHQYVPHWKLLRQLGGRWQQSYVSHTTDEARQAEAANSFRLSNLSFLPSLVSMNIQLKRWTLTVEGDAFEHDMAWRVSKKTHKNWFKKMKKCRSKHNQIYMQQHVCGTPNQHKVTEC